MPKSEQAIGSSMWQIRILNNKFWVSVLFVEGAVCPKVSKQSGQSTFHSDGLNDGIVCFFDMFVVHWIDPMLQSRWRVLMWFCFWWLRIVKDGALVCAVVACYR